jgi:hypothetical protein
MADYMRTNDYTLPQFARAMDENYFAKGLGIDAAGFVF